MVYVLTCEIGQEALTNGVSDGGFVDTNLLHWYKYNSNTNNNLNIHIQQAPGKGLCPQVHYLF